MLFNQFNKSLNRNLRELGKVQQQLSSGKRLTKPSDDVIAARGALAYKVSIDEIAQYDRNLNEGISALASTEQQFQSLHHIINRARELAVAEGNDIATAATRELTAYEVQNLFNEMIDTGNAKLKNRYLFSGFLTSTPAFDASGTYQGDSNIHEIFINEGLKARINVTGDTAFSDMTKQLSDVLGSTAGMGTLRITTGTGNPVILPIKDTVTNASPEEVRDAINAPMTGYYNVADVIGTGRLTLRAGISDPVNLTVDTTNNTPALLRDAINALNMGIEAGLATDTVTGQVRMFFRPTNAGDPISIEIARDDDGDDVDINGLSALLHTDLRTNLTANALGIEAFAINDTAGTRLLFAPNIPRTSFSIEVDENGNANFADAADTDTTGLSRIYHNPAVATNLTGSISFFTIVDHLKNSLLSNDGAGVRGSIFLLDGALDSLINTTADLGARMRYLDDQKDRLLDTEISHRANLSILEDADIAKAAIDMQKIQASLEAMRIASLKSISQSLFDFLG
jgi:flagellar hook-associated protein 3